MMSEIAQSVARKFLAAKLTKKWLMGIRRGWLKLMRPTITDYESVLAAHDQLSEFVRRLNDQVTYVRPGGAKRLLDSGFEAKLKKAVEALEQGIDDSRSRARGWKDYIDGTAVSLQWGEDRTEDAEKMLEIYRKDFAEATGTSVEMRGRRWKAVDLTFLLDQVLKLLRLDAAAIQKHDEANPEAPFEGPPETFTEFSIGRMKVVVDDRTVTPVQIDKYAKLLVEAKRRLEKRGFGKAWYGEVFIQCEECGGENPLGKEFGVGGHYHTGPNTIVIYERPSNHNVKLMVHELGHRWWYKHMNRADRLRFQDWIAAGLAPVSEYGSKKDSEAYAEVFAWYVLQRPMTSEQATTFKMVSQGQGAAGRVAREAGQSSSSSRILS